MYITVMFILHNPITIHVHVATMGYNGAEDSKNQKKCCHARVSVGQSPPRTGPTALSGSVRLSAHHLSCVSEYGKEEQA